MKKIYIAPKIDVIILDSLCSGGLQTASVLKGQPIGECIDRFSVFGEETTKKDDKYTGLWGQSNSKNWGND